MGPKWWGEPINSGNTIVAAHEGGACKAVLVLSAKPPLDHWA